MHSTHNILGDLSEGSSGGLESDDQPCKPKSSVLKTFGSPEVTAAEKGPIVDKNHCLHRQSELSCVGNTTSGNAVKLMDDNQMQSELDCNLAVALHTYSE